MKMHIAHVYIQCLLQLDGSILAGVFLTSSSCVVPKSSYSSNAAISSLLVAWSSNCSIVASRTKSMVETSALKEAATETGGCSAPTHFLWTSIGLTEKLSRIRPHRAHKHVLLRPKTPLQQQIYSE